MHFDTVEHGTVTLSKGEFVNEAGRPIHAQAVYRAAHDGRWHVSLPFPATNAPAHSVGAPACYSVWQRGGRWIRSGKCHREDGPANNGDWWLQGQPHRIEGPASSDGTWLVGFRPVRPRGWQRRARRLRWLLPQHK